MQVTLLSTKPLHSNNSDEFVPFPPWDKQLEFRSAVPLNQSHYFMVRSCGFATSDEACRAAEALCQSLLMAAAKHNYGASVQDVEIVESTALLVLATRPSLSIIQPPSDFANQLTAFVGKPPLKRQQRVAAELITDALFQPSHETRFLMGIIAVETLCAPYKKNNEGNSKRCQRVIRKFLDDNRASNFAKLYEKRNDFAHEGRRKGALANEAVEARQIATDLLLLRFKRNGTYHAPDNPLQNLPQPNVLTRR